MGGGEAIAVQHLQSLHNALIRQKSELEAKIDGIAAALSAMGAPSSSPGEPAPRRGRRPRAARAGRRSGRPPRASGSPFRSGSLKETIYRVLKAAGRPMAVKDITQGVRDSGFETRNQTLSKSVGIALTQMPGVAKVRRGTFKAK